MTETPSAGQVFAASRDHLIRRTAGVHKLTGANAYAVSAAGAEVTLSDGRRVLDAGTWATSMLGHAHPEVVAAVARQSATLPAGVRGLANSPSAQLAGRLAALAAPSRLERAWFGANGADVVEAALKLARVARGRPGVVAAEGGFHGRTLGALAASDGDRNRGLLAPLLSGVTFIDPTADPPGPRDWPSDTAAIVIEIIPGRGGVLPVPPDSLRRLVAAARDIGALVVIDEIQTGLWRSGEFSLALALGLDPDGLLLGKTLGGGVMPLSALLCTAELAAPLEADPMLHSQTFSGHPLACAAGVAALEVLPRLMEQRGPAIEAWLADLAERLARTGTQADIRVHGLMLSLEFASAGTAERFVMETARAGLLLAPCDIDRRAVRVLPPLVLTESQAETAAAILLDVYSRAGSWTAPAVASAR